MNSYVTATIILGEISLVLLIALGILLFITLRKKSHIQNGIKNLVNKLVSNQEERASKLKTILKDSYHLDESQVDETADKIVQQENILYKNLIHIYAKGDQENIGKIDEKITELISTYHGLTSKPVDAITDIQVPEADAVAPQDTAEPETEAVTSQDTTEPGEESIGKDLKIEKLEGTVDTLTNENNRLKDELTVSKEKVDVITKNYNDLTNEYANAFADQMSGGGADDSAKVDDQAKEAPQDSNDTNATTEDSMENTESAETDINEPDQETDESIDSESLEEDIEALLGQGITADSDDTNALNTETASADSSDDLDFDITFESITADDDNEKDPTENVESTAGAESDSPAPPQTSEPAASEPKAPDQKPAEPKK